MSKRFLGAIPAAVILVALATSYLPFISDDALISLRYAQRFLEGQGLTWTAGEAVEGYSNLLWILLSAALGWIGVDLIDAVRLLGYIGSLATLLALHRAVQRPGPWEWLPGMAASQALALCGPIAVWTVGGLEQPLVAALLAWAITTGMPLLEDDPPPRAWLLPGTLLALLCWTRPDAPLFAAAMFGGLIVARGRDSKTLKLSLSLIALPLLAYLAQLGGRLAYYGEWVPNSALAKVAFTGTRLTQGLAYVGEGLLWSLPLGFAAVVLAFWPSTDAMHTRRVRFVAAPLLIWTAYVVVIGGDSFPGRRHLVPTLVLLAFLLAEGLRQRIRSSDSKPVRIGAAVVIGLLALGFAHIGDPQNQRARLERWEWDGEVAGKLLRNAFPADTLIAVDAAGTLPYFSGLPSVDMLGINDRYLASHRPENFGTGDLGHELGDGEYVLERAPDLIMFCGPAGGAQPCFLSGRELVEAPLFRKRYRLVTFAADDPRLFVFQPWVRAEGGRVGITRANDRVEVPAYLMMATGQTVARLDEPSSTLEDDAPGRLVVDVSPNAPAGIAGLMLTPGAWNLTVEPPSAVRLSVGRSGTVQRLGRGPGKVFFRLPPNSAWRVDVLVESTSGQATFESLVFERSSSGR
jgi:arabinofuranosyltransferase